jgi:ribosomal protein S12 methylthiotransferase
MTSTPNKPLNVALVSLGCPKNLVDSEKILAHLAEGGCVVAAPIDQADVIVVNTCGFIAPAVQESLDVIAEAVAHKRSGRARRVVVAGCLASRDGEKLFELAPGIDAVVGVNDRESILSAVTGRRHVTRVSAWAGGVAGDQGRFRLTPPHTAYLRIAEGCGRRCTFCTIPAIRGPFRSKPPEQVLAEARELVADGAVELNLIAQDTTAYGSDLPRAPGADGSGSLAGLLRCLDGLDGVEWIRLMYAYPHRFGEDLIDALADCPHVVPYLDIPLQHISDAVLKRMGRAVTRKHIVALLDRLRRRIDGLVLRTTLIVGFPGETDGQFEELLAFVKDFRFDALGVFPYWPEEGTPACRLRGAVDEHVKQRRLEAVMLAQQGIAFQANDQRVGQAVRVLVDGTDADGNCVGRHYGQAPDVDSICRLTAPRSAGMFVDGRVAAYDGYDLIVECPQGPGRGSGRTGRARRAGTRAGHAAPHATGSSRKAEKR